MRNRAHLPARSWTYELSSHANDAEMRRASDWLDATCRAKHVPNEQAERLLLCLSEVLTNVIQHGGTTQPIALCLEVSIDRREASVTVSDAARAFDPLSMPRRTKPQSLAEASTNGMGLQIVRRCSDILHYRHEGGRNHLTFGMRWKAQ